MKYWLDTEFIEDGKTIDLISIGIVAEDGRVFYCEVIEAELWRADEWVKKNVLPHLRCRRGSQPHWIAFDGEVGGYWARDSIAGAIKEFCDPATYGKPEFWGYYADYDWVVFCQLFGRMIDLPKGFPMYCRDLKQWADMLGNPELPKQDSTEHHALADARWNHVAYDFLNGLATSSQTRNLATGSATKLGRAEGEKSAEPLTFKEEE